jgi:hypothetical protein
MLEYLFLGEIYLYGLHSSHSIESLSNQMPYSSHDEFLQHHPILKELVFAANFDVGVGIYCDRPE